MRTTCELWWTALQVRKTVGKPLRSQFFEIAALRRHRLAVREYFDYRLFDDERFTAQQKREYTGRRFQWTVYRAVNDPGLIVRSGIRGSWNGMIDKPLLDVLMKDAGIPRPHTYAVFDTAGGSSSGIPVIRTIPELEAMLRMHGRDGCFAKPARAASGDGACSILKVVDDDVVLGDGGRLTIAELARTLSARERMVIQERLRPHSELREGIGETLATLRVVVLRGDALSTIHRIVLRIPVGTNMVDNFAKGSTGNLVGVVDPSSGRVNRVYGHLGMEQRRIDRHPTTGRMLESMVLPEWDVALAAIDHASRAFAGMPLQSWDLALTERGPVMIEVNDVSSQDILQLGGPPGMLDSELYAFLRERGIKWPDPHPAR